MEWNLFSSYISRENKMGYPVSREKGRGPSNPGRCVTATGDEATGARRQQRQGNRSDHGKWRLLLAMVAVLRWLCQV
jgi:hypothetical protein